MAYGDSGLGGNSLKSGKGIDQSSMKWVKFNIDFKRWMGGEECEKGCSKEGNDHVQI